MPAVSAMYDDQSPDRADAEAGSVGWVPQFGLRGLLGFVALMAVWFAVTRVYGYAWGIVLGWFALLVFVHVAANVWGARRRGGHHYCGGRADRVPAGDASAGIPVRRP